MKKAKVSPSKGLSKKTKSNIVKKARAGKDIGKKGKGFAKVMANVKGSKEKKQRVAAAVMWRGVKRRRRK